MGATCTSLYQFFSETGTESGTDRIEANVSEKLRRKGEKDEKAKNVTGTNIIILFLYF